MNDPVPGPPDADGESPAPLHSQKRVAMVVNAEEGWRVVVGNPAFVDTPFILAISWRRPDLAVARVQPT
jgi:hypothetical protein